MQVVTKSPHERLQKPLILPLDILTLRQRPGCAHATPFLIAAMDAERQNSTMQRVADKSSLTLSLNDAVLQRNKKLAASLLQQGADPTWRAGESAPAILLAAMRSDRSMVRQLLTGHPDIKKIVDDFMSATSQDLSVDADAAHELLMYAAQAIWLYTKYDSKFFPLSCAVVPREALQGLEAYMGSVTDERWQAAKLTVCADIDNMQAYYELHWWEWDSGVFNVLQPTSRVAAGTKCKADTWITVDSILQHVGACSQYQRRVTAAGSAAALGPARLYVAGWGALAMLTLYTICTCKKWRIGDLPTALVPLPSQHGSKRAFLVVCTHVLVLAEWMGMCYYLWQLYHNAKNLQCSDPTTHCYDEVVQCWWDSVIWPCSFVLMAAALRCAAAVARYCLTQLSSALLRVAVLVLPVIPEGSVCALLRDGITVRSLTTAEAMCCAKHSPAAVVRVLYAWMQSREGEQTDVLMAALAAKDYTAVSAILQVLELADTRQPDVSDDDSAVTVSTGSTGSTSPAAGADSAVTAKVLRTLHAFAVELEARAIFSDAVVLQHDSNSRFHLASELLMLTVMATAAAAAATEGQYTQKKREQLMLHYAQQRSAEAAA
eukprot:6597-Heterococcus_DN1.PRE.1